MDHATLELPTQCAYTTDGWATHRPYMLVMLAKGGRGTMYFVMTKSVFDSSPFEKIWCDSNDTGETFFPIICTTVYIGILKPALVHTRIYVWTHVESNHDI